MIDKQWFDKQVKERNLQDFSNEIYKELEETLKNTFNAKVKEIKNKKKILAIDNAKERIRASEVFSKEVLKKMPSWVKKDIDNAFVIGTSKSVIQTSNGKKYHIKNKLNDLAGSEWTFFLNSIICTRYSTNGKESFAHHIRKIHPSPKPPQLMQQIIEFFTKENDLVLDYFMGVGGTLLGASLSNRRAIGIDLSSKYIQAYKQANEYLKLKEQITIQADSLNLLKNPQKMKAVLNNEEVSLILIDPPYGDMLSRPKTGETLKKGGDISPTPFTDYKEDLGNMEWKDFLKAFRKSVKIP